MSTTTSTIPPRAFIWRRLHSLMGLWIVLFLIEHLLTNSQAALLLGDQGRGFVEMVNWLHNLPYLQVIEVILLGVPILVHMILGVKYLFISKFNSHRTDGSKPALPEYGRNHAYTWQRITSWILLIGLIGHVVKFRFLEYPDSINQGTRSFYFVRLNVDNGLYTVASRLGVELYDQKAIQKEKKHLEERMHESALIEASNALLADSHKWFEGASAVPYDSQKEMILSSAERYKQKIQWVDVLERQHLAKDQVVAVSDNFGTATLMSVRDTFKSPIYVGLYTIFVLAACFHAFNGLWTFMITWGVVLKMSAQRSMAKFAIAIMLVVLFLGLASIWGTYWLNLKY